MSYTSDYGASGPITAAQKIAEVACGRLSGSSLPPRFWLADPWKGAYLRQVMAANRLLKVFDEEAVFAALAAHARIREVGSSIFSEKVAVEQVRLDRERVRAESAAPIEASDASESPRPAARRGNTRSKLKGL